MASPTKHDAPHAGSMKPTPGVGGAPATAGGMTPMAGHVAQTPETRGAEPTMVEGIDPVLLHRLVPGGRQRRRCGEPALAQGQQTWEQGATLVACAAGAGLDRGRPGSGAPGDARAASAKDQTMSGTIEPVLVEGLDQVLLIRLYPEAEALSAAADAALAQGVENCGRRHRARKLESSQYEPVLEVDAPEGGGPDPAPTAPPVNVDVPHVQQAGSELTCTMGNWEAHASRSRTATPISAQLDGADTAQRRRHGIAANRGG